MRKAIFACIIFFSPAILFAQLNFYFTPEIYGKSVDGLGVFQIQNVSNESKGGHILITVKETTTQSLVVNITTPELILPPGMLQFPRTYFLRSAFNFFNNSYSSIANQTKNLPPGEYSYCFRFVPDKLIQDETENCFDAMVLPMVPMQLITPANGDSICMKRPVLSWQPPMPFAAGTRFRLLLVQKTKGANAESILMDRPLLLLDNISTTTLNYPSNYPELEEGKTYVWQVIAFQNRIIISKSEIWEFTIQCKEPAHPVPDDSYRELKLIARENYYIANHYIKFSYNNSYNVKRLTYSITAISQNGEKVKHLPEIDIHGGLNNIDLDISDLKLEPGKNYLLKIYPFNEPTLELTFIYKED